MTQFGAQVPDVQQICFVVGELEYGKHLRECELES